MFSSLQHSSIAIELWLWRHKNLHVKIHSLKLHSSRNDICNVYKAHTTLTLQVGFIRLS